MCCSIYLLQNIYSLLTVVFPLLREKTKTPFLQCTLAGYVPDEMFYTFPGLAGWCLTKSALHLSLASCCSGPQAPGDHYLVAHLPLDAVI